MFFEANNGFVMTDGTFDGSAHRTASLHGASSYVLQTTVNFETGHIQWSHDGTVLSRIQYGKLTRGDWYFTICTGASSSFSLEFVTKKDHKTLSGVTEGGGAGSKDDLSSRRRGELDSEA